MGEASSSDCHVRIPSPHAQEVAVLDADRRVAADAETPLRTGKALSRLVHESCGHLHGPRSIDDDGIALGFEAHRHLIDHRIRITAAASYTHRDEREHVHRSVVT